MTASLFRDLLEKLPILSRYARTRGWFYVISWLHRLTGTTLFALMMVYLCIFSSSQNLNLFQTGLRPQVQPIFLILAWASSLILGFHALNGGRLILYELFGRRNDTEMLRWATVLTAAFSAITGLMMIMKNQHVSAFFFWLMALLFGAIATSAVARRMKKKPHALLWRLQRMSAAFLFTTVPAFLLFLCLRPNHAKTAHAAIAWIENGFARMAILIVTIGTLYHVGYGLFSIAHDYFSSKPARTGMATMISVVIVLLFAFALRIILSI